MSKSFLTIAATLALVSLVSGGAQAGSSSSAPTKISHATRTTSVDHLGDHRPTQTAQFAITEFSSSSAKRSTQTH